MTNASSGELPDLPADAARSYLQYRFPLQLAADFYVFDLQTMVGDTGAKQSLTKVYCMVGFALV